jgi:hypothetical protein
MADRRHAEVCEVLGRQLGEACLIERIFPECLFVAFQVGAAQPGRDTHGSHTHTWPHSSTSDNRRHVPRMRNSVYPSPRGCTRSLAVKRSYRRAKPGAGPTIPTRFSLPTG